MADGDSGVAVELASLRGVMDTGFARLEGQINLLVHTSDDNRRDLNDLSDRVTALEARRVPWPLVVAVSGVMSTVVAALAFLAQNP